MIVINFLIAFGIALLTGMGIGSGGLLTLWLTLFHGIGQLQAQGLNLLFFVISSAGALFFHFRKRKILFSHLPPMILAGVIGALAGTYLSRLIPAAVLRKCFGGMMTLAGTVTLIRSGKELLTGHRQRKKQ